MQRLIDRLHDMADAVMQAVLFFLIGAAIGLAQLASSGEPVTWRLGISRAITSGALSMSAAAVLIPFPETGMVALIGVAAALGSLGTSALENLLVRMLGRGRGGDK